MPIKAKRMLNRAESARSITVYVMCKKHEQADTSKPPVTKGIEASREPTPSSMLIQGSNTNIADSAKAIQHG
ncbi:MULTISPECIES: hypothetical protein [Aphanothece]|uniref:hypothetical protein n=1 Tax=Aphanothece TaxID=1121 RepID=UPI003984FEDC